MSGDIETEEAQSCIHGSVPKRVLARCEKTQQLLNPGPLEAEKSCRTDTHPLCEGFGAVEQCTPRPADVRRAVSWTVEESIPKPRVVHTIKPLGYLANLGFAEGPDICTRKERMYEFRVSHAPSTVLVLAVRPNLETLR